MALHKPYKLSSIQCKNVFQILFFYKEGIKLYCFQLYQEGIINGLYNKWFHSNSLCSIDELSGTRLETIMSLLVMLGAGILVSLMILLAEKLASFRAKSTILKK